MDKPGHFPVVGVGASAGGVEALQVLFRAMPDPPLAAAFVVIMHLTGGRKSALPDIIGHCTTMPVVPAVDGDVLKAGHVHVLPDDSLITIAGGACGAMPMARRSSARPASTVARAVPETSCM